MKFFTISILALTAISIGNANGYELGTHARLTNAAFEQSILHDTSFMHDLGLDPNDPQPFGEIYLDVSGATINERNRNAFEAGYMPDGAKPLSINGWLMRGAIREDDLGQILGVNVGDDPHDDPYGNIFRVFNHFYDPVLDRPLTTLGVALGQKAPDWGMGSANAFTQPNTPDTSRRNHFTVFDAREAMYRALTGRDSQGNVIAATEGDRNKYWATTFRALGDVVHLVQDMGQPQHTRNDPHSGKGPAVVQALLTGHASVFEEYIDARATGAASYSIDGLPPKQWPPLIYTGYPSPAFTKYSDFWSTRNGVSGRGLADYSNRGFFSAGTNLGGNGYVSPSNNAASYTPESASGLLPNQPQKINFLRGNVYDYNLNPGAANIRMTTESLFDYFLFTNKTYSLNRFNYDDMADLLIPRAVSYSAGLINYFFRGKIDMEPDPTTPGGFLIKNLGTEPMNGTFALYYDDVSGNRYLVPGTGTGTTWAGLTINAGGQNVVSFTIPTNPAPKTKGKYMLVFNGNMGTEVTSGVVGAVAGKEVKLPVVSAISGFYDPLYFNNRTIPETGILTPITSLGLSSALFHDATHGICEYWDENAGQWAMATINEFWEKTPITMPSTWTPLSSGNRLITTSSGYMLQDTAHFYFLNLDGSINKTVDLDYSTPSVNLTIADQWIPALSRLASYRARNGLGFSWPDIELMDEAGKMDYSIWLINADGYLITNVFWFAGKFYALAIKRISNIWYLRLLSFDVAPGYTPDTDVSYEGTVIATINMNTNWQYGFAQHENKLYIWPMDFTKPGYIVSPDGTIEQTGNPSHYLQEYLTIFSTFWLNIRPPE